MSLTQTAYISKSKTPNRAQLNTAIQALGLNLVVDDFYVPFACQGFLPCILNGKASGFEIYFESSTEPLIDSPHMKEQIGDRDSAITFRWGGDMSELCCVMIVSAALSISYDSIIHYPDDDIIYTGQQLVDEAKGTFKYLK